MHTDEFSFQRSRGIVWVCDLASSSKHLNDNATAAQFETFLPRLHWISKVLVEAAGGTFLKWTGDGFLAWFETPLHRELGQHARAVFEAVTQLTFMVNVTQLGTSPEHKFRIRHGVTYEQDALLTKIAHTNGHQSMDIIGRSVVLAFRLSEIRALYPNVVAEAIVAKAAKDAGYSSIQFKSWVPSSVEMDRYFKGERWGTRGLVISVDRKHRQKNIKSIVSNAKRVISKAESKDISSVDPDITFSSRVIEMMLHGPAWAKEVLLEETRFIEEELLGSLKKVTEIMSSEIEKSKSQPKN